MLCGLTAAADLSIPQPVTTGRCLTNVAQIGTLSAADFLEPCEVQLTGIVTFVDTNRDLLVLQDATGAVALNFPIAEFHLQVGHLVTLEGTNCAPLFAAFPDYPYRPSGRDVCPSFEIPKNWGTYNLSRMRGYLHPQVTGDYRFYIASDNSSELWLSTDAAQTAARKIASVPHFAWTEPRQWSKYVSQSSGLIRLKAGSTYYIEALQEQTSLGENLSVGWQEPGSPEIAVIGGQFLTPWEEFPARTQTVTNGILREYWTNYFANDVEGLFGARPYESALTIKEVAVTDHGSGELPAPVVIAWNQPLRAENNYRWVQKEGLIKFAGDDGHSASLEIFDGQNLIPVRVLRWSADQAKQLRKFTNAVVRVAGVGEGIKNENGILMPGLLWATAESSLSYEAGPTNAFAPIANQSASPSNTGNPAMSPYYGTGGEVTFNARVFGEDYIFVQEGNSALRIIPENDAIKDRFKVGQYVYVGGTFEPSQTPPTITPFFVSEYGWHSMPDPIVFSTGMNVNNSQTGHWCEFEGVVQAANTNGSLTLATKDGFIYLWPGQNPATNLSQYVDSKLRARGVLLPDLTDWPMLLVPSRNFLYVVEEPPAAPFKITQRSITSLLTESGEDWQGHRVRVCGEITYYDSNSFFLQDESGGIRVQTPVPLANGVGETVEVVGFQTLMGTVQTLTAPLVRRANATSKVHSQPLDLSGAFSRNQNGTLVQTVAFLLTQKTNGNAQVLELQAQHRIFVATLAAGLGQLPTLLPGSQLRVTGVCEEENSSTPGNGHKLMNPAVFSPLNILLRSPADVTLLSGPPWWTWKRTATLIAILLAILVVAGLRVYLLQQRLQRQQAAQFLFSQQVLRKLEEERRRIAANLHDSLGQALLVIKNHAILAHDPETGGPGIKDRLDEISGTTSRAIEEVRRITHDLRPYQLDRLGLTQAIRACVNQIAGNSPIAFASRVEEIDNRLDKEAEIHVYRIVQEAVNNVNKHSAATEATVVIKNRANSVSLSIRDNGKGFEPAKLSSQPIEPGFGLTGIGERVRILKGNLVVVSKPGGGTNLTVNIPVKTA